MLGIHDHDNQPPLPDQFQIWRDSVASWIAQEQRSLEAARKSGDLDAAAFAGMSIRKYGIEWAQMQDAVDKRRANLLINGTNDFNSSTLTDAEKSHPAGIREQIARIALSEEAKVFKQMLTTIALSDDIAKTIIDKGRFEQALEQLPAFKALVESSPTLTALQNSRKGAAKAAA